MINLAALTSSLDHHLALPVLAGAMLPDLPIGLLYLDGRLRQKLPPARIWSEVYSQKGWLRLIHGMHSVPLALLGWGLAGWLKSPAVAAFFVSMLLHAAADLPVHGKDAHRHFLPFSSYRFISPLSYWDVEHHAKWVGALELGLVIASAWLVAGWATALWARCLLGAVSMGYVLHYRKLVLTPLPDPGTS